MVLFMNDASSQHLGSEMDFERISDSVVMKILNQFCFSDVGCMVLESILHPKSPKANSCPARIELHRLELDFLSRFLLTLCKAYRVTVDTKQNIASVTRPRDGSYLASFVAHRTFALCVPFVR